MDRGRNLSVFNSLYSRRVSGRPGRFRIRRRNQRTNPNPDLIPDSESVYKKDKEKIERVQHRATKLVLKYKSADWCKLKNEISKLTDEYFDSDPNSQDVNTNWTFFRDNLTTLMNNTIPHCNTFRLQTKLNPAHTRIHYLDNRFLK